MEKDKKEIGMEKLIRYLLESKGDEYKEEYYEWYRDVELEQNIDSLSELRLFVKWLVENDKIDRDKELKENGLFRKYFYDLEYVKNYDRLVMWLSVEDEPINFLVSILK